MKSVSIQYLLAIQKLKEKSFVPKRTIVLTFVPDEEIGGEDGMCALLEAKLWDLNDIAIALDEGLANPGPNYTLFYGERKAEWVVVRAEGPTGHGSQFIQKTAVEKLLHILNAAQAFRAQQEQALGYDAHGCTHGKAKTLGDVTTINCTYLKAGKTEGTYALNVIPSEAVAGFDIRITPHMDIQGMYGLLDEWCKEEGVSWKRVFKNISEGHDATETEGNVYFEKLKEVVEKRGIGLE